MPVQAPRCDRDRPPRNAELRADIPLCRYDLRGALPRRLLCHPLRPPPRPARVVRPGELHKAEWAEVALEAAEWRIPTARMKSRAIHIVPLSTQAVAVLREFHALTGHGVGQYPFPGPLGKAAESENTVNAAFRRVGYDKDT